MTQTEEKATVADLIGTKRQSDQYAEMAGY